jgi:poly-gamma-glutamate synthesis protein (capsule biosynthesis protein)
MEFSSGPVPAAVRALMIGRSWHPDPRCPAWDQLVHVTLEHHDLAGEPTMGELVVAAAIVAPTRALFSRLWSIGFPIARMRLVDHFDASDDRSMAADNSSGFNFRVVAGTQVLSQHALGLAIDLNPVENPWIGERGLVPAAGQEFIDRRHVRPGMIVRPGPVTALLDELGWEWGGDWRHARDYHHIVWSRPGPVR